MDSVKTVIQSLLISMEDLTQPQKKFILTLFSTHLAWKTRPGYCSKCDRFLGKVDRYKQLSIQDTDLNWYLWVNENIGELLSMRDVEDFSLSKKTIGDSLTKYTEKCNFK